jgi:hypothetical protein
MKLPFTFWLFLPIDICRVIAWFVKVIRGFIDARQFAWVRFVTNLCHYTELTPSAVLFSGLFLSIMSSSFSCSMQNEKVYAQPAIRA